MDVTYTECTTFSDANCDRWCALATGPGDSYVKGSGLWGYCLPSCPYRTAKAEEEARKRANVTGRCEAGNSERPKLIWPRFKIEREEHGNTWVENGSCPTVLSSTSSSSYSPPSLSASHNCSFPFYYKNKIHTVCTSVDDPDCRFWCSTENDGGFHRSSTSRWAYCATSCIPNYGRCHVEERCKTGPDTAHFYEQEFTGFEFMESEDPDFDFYTMDND